MARAHVGPQAPKHPGIRRLTVKKIQEPGDQGRERKGFRTFKPKSAISTFKNPFPWMSDTEARVYLALEGRNIPFSWRFFDGEAPTFRTQLPSYNPEFTLREYKKVIMVEGNFYGSIPGVLDQISLADALLQFDGWTVLVLFASEVATDLNQKLDGFGLANPTFRGPPRPNPFGHPDVRGGFRKHMQDLALARIGHRDIKGGTRDISHRGAHRHLAGRARNRARQQTSGSGY